MYFLLLVELVLLIADNDVVVVELVVLEMVLDIEVLMNLRVVVLDLLDCSVGFRVRKRAKPPGAKRREASNIRV